MNVKVCMGAGARPAERGQTVPGSATPAPWWGGLALPQLTGKVCLTGWGCLGQGTPRAGLTSVLGTGTHLIPILGWTGKGTHLSQDG